MSNRDIRPTSLVGIARLAKEIKAARKIPHHQALKEAAKAAGFENHRHAVNKLPAHPKKSGPSASNRLRITVHWRDRNSRTGGSETYWVDLKSPWTDLVSPRQMQKARFLAWLQPWAPDHLVHSDLLTSQEEARRNVCGAIRTLQFMEATGLKPSNSQHRAYPGGKSSNAIPGHDHARTWYEPSSKSYIFVDEPYESAAEARGAQRAAWAAQHAYEVLVPSWPGMYNPRSRAGSRLHLIAPKSKSSLLKTLATALNRLPLPVTNETWRGESVPRQSRVEKRE